MLAKGNLEVTMTLPSDTEIRFTCFFRRSRQILFEAWTRPEHIRHWWGCHGATISTCEIDHRVVDFALGVIPFVGGFDQLSPKLISEFSDICLVQGCLLVQNVSGGPGCDSGNNADQFRASRVKRARTAAEEYHRR